nr:immunoglobulin light chain junction region [Macaca mulatta]
CLQTKISPRTF